MKICKQAKPIIREISTAEIIGAKGIAKSGNPIMALAECTSRCESPVPYARKTCIDMCMKQKGYNNY